jgi:hypothetical protein
MIRIDNLRDLESEEDGEFSDDKEELEAREACTPYVVHKYNPPEYGDAIVDDDMWRWTHPYE